MGSLSALTILAGLADAIPPGPNATLAKSLGLPVTAALLTLLVSTAGLPAGGLALGKLERPTGPQHGEVPWWAWLRGFFECSADPGPALRLPRHRRGDLFGDHRDGGGAHLTRARAFWLDRISSAPGERLTDRRGGVDGDWGGGFFI